MRPSSLVLIGMPGAGKSTLGVQLAKRLVKTFVDTDLLIQAESGMSLQEYLDQQGYLALRALEEKVLLSHHFDGCVVATGGSAVYSDKAMQHLKTFGPTVYLSISFDTMRKRITNQGSRGLACAPGTRLEELYRERLHLYEKYHDIKVDCDSLPQEEAMEWIVHQLYRS